MTTNLTHDMNVQQRWYQTDLLLGVFLSALLFAIPISSSLKSIALVASIVLLLLTKINTAILNDLIKKPWVRAILGFFLLVLLECYQSPATWSEQLFVIEKYSKLLWLPLLTLGFANKKTRTWGLHAFLAAMFLICCIAFARATGILSSTAAPGSVFRNYIMIGHMMAFASYLAAFLALKTPQYRIPYLALCLMFSYEVLFISIGRTGYVIYFMLVALFMLQFLPKKYVLIGFVAFLLMGLTALHFSTTMQQGLQSVQANVHEFQHGEKDTSVGFRFQFQQFAFKLFKQSPLIGNGTGSLTYYFDEQHPVPVWNRQLREPHNQYWLIAAEFGMVGLFAYLTLLLALTTACFRLRELKYIAMALLLPFVVGCMSDSLLFYSGSGYFFLVFMALCLGESIDFLHNR